MKLDIGCGNNKKKDFFGIDKFKSPDVDQLVDIDKGLPFQDNYVGEIYCSHVLEHIDNFEFVMDEIYRICRDKTIIIIRVPHFSGRGAFHEFHKRFFRYDSFLDYQRKEKDMTVTNNHTQFKMVERKILFLKRKFYFYNYFFEWFFNLHERMCNHYENSFLRNIIPAGEVYIKLKVLKSKEKEIFN